LYGTLFGKLSQEITGSTSLRKEKLLVRTLNAREIHKECKAGW
jgi:hypothetical protein